MHSLLDHLTLKKLRLTNVDLILLKIHGQNLMFVFISLLFYLSFLILKLFSYVLDLWFYGRSIQRDFEE